jgi:hypothetical protein
VIVAPRPVRVLLPPIQPSEIPILDVALAEIQAICTFFPAIPPVVVPARLVVNADRAGVGSDEGSRQQ